MVDEIIKIKQELFPSLSDHTRLDVLQRKREELREKINPVYIWGTAILGEFVYRQCNLQAISVAGFIDSDKKKQDQRLHDLPILSPEEADKEIFVVIACFYWWDVKTKLSKLEFGGWAYYEELSLLGIGFPVFYQAFEGLWEDIEDHWPDYVRVYQMLQDDRSKEILKKMLLFRQYMDVDFAKEAFDLSICMGKQYFDREIMVSGRNEVFIDGGGYLGETSLDFIEWASNCNRKIYLFEPDAALIEKAKKNLDQYDGIEFCQCGLGSKNTALCYNRLENGGGAFSPEGNTMEQIVSLNGFIHDTVTFIKFDIEGFEEEALQGAEQIIKRDKPRIAISAYHKTSDLYRIVDLVTRMRCDYKIYLRHYTKGYADTVLYFV